MSLQLFLMRSLNDLPMDLMINIGLSLLEGKGSTYLPILLLIYKSLVRETTYRVIIPFFFFFSTFKDV